jgi:phospholipid/cholesterol/gamma-HCH transport system substrate-binding protein
MSDNNAQLIKSGLFLIIGTIVILATILLLGGDKKFFSKQALLHVEFPQVQGLNMGAVVSLAGLPIGNVSKLTYNPSTGMIDVEMKIRQKAFKDLTEGTQADIRTQGALGDKYIYIIPGPSNSPQLKNNSHIQDIKSPDIMAILSEKGGEATKVFDIINQLHALTKSINEGDRVNRILTNLDEGSHSLNKIAKKSEQSFEKFDRVITKIDQGEGTLGALIADPSIHDQIKTLLGGSNRKSHVKSLMRRSVNSEKKN